MGRKQKFIDEQLAKAYLKGRDDAQREMYALIRRLEAEIERLRPKNKRTHGKTRREN